LPFVIYGGGSGAAYDLSIDEIRYEAGAVAPPNSSSAASSSTVGGGGASSVSSAVSSSSSKSSSAASSVSSSSASSAASSSGTAGYVVTFNGNGATTQANPQTKTVTSPATTVGTLPTPPARTGYIFVNWNTAADGSGTVFTASTTVTANRTVYAQWDENLSNANVTLLSIAGKVTGNQNVRSASSTSGSIVTVLPQNSFVHIVKIDADSKWLVVEYAKNQIAYVSSGSVTEAVLTSRVGKATASKTVYAAQSATANKVGVIEQNSFILLIEKSGTWYKILYNGTQVGYVTVNSIVVPQGVVDTVTSSPNITVVNKASTNNPKFNNVAGKRGPEAYNQIINQFNVGQNTPNSTGGYTTTTYNARYNQSRSETGAVTATYCNIFNWDVMTAMKVHFPHWAKQEAGNYLTPISGRTHVKEPYVPPAGTANGTSGMYELNANMLYEWMRQYGKEYGWTEVDPTIAQNRANNGFPTVTVWRNNSDSSSGHVQVVRPENSSYEYTTSAKGSVVAQAGSSNYNNGYVSTAYGTIPTTANKTYALKYYTHDITTINGGSDAHNQPEANSIDSNDPGYQAVVP